MSPSILKNVYYIVVFNCSNGMFPVRISSIVIPVSVIVLSPVLQI